MENNQLKPSEKIQNLYSDIGKLITSSLDISTIIKAIMDQIELFFKPVNWSILRWDPIKEELYFILAKGLDPEVAQNIRLKLGEGIAGQVAKTGKSILVTDAQKDSRFSQKTDNLSGFKTESIIAVPMLFHQETLGVIELINTIDGANFSQKELAILETIADFSAIALSNAMAYEHISWLAIHDPLTRLYNFAQLDHLVERFSEGGGGQKRQTDSQFIGLIWIDVDNFKAVNDIYGHRVGDEVLIKTAEVLQSFCRSTDLAIRVGGDEFLIVLMNLKEEDLQKTLTRITKQLEEASHKIQPATGFSFGMSTGLKSDIKKLLKEADQKMYQLKGKKSSSRDAQ